MALMAQAAPDGGLRMAGTEGDRRRMIALYWVNMLDGPTPESQWFGPTGDIAVIQKVYRWPLSAGERNGMIHKVLQRITAEGDQEGFDAATRWEAGDTRK